MLELLDPVLVCRKTLFVRVRFITQGDSIVLKITIIPTGTSLWLRSAAVAFVQARPTMLGVGATTLRIAESLLRPRHIRVDNKELEDSCC